MKITHAQWPLRVVGHTVYLDEDEQHAGKLPMAHALKQLRLSAMHLENGDSLSARQTSARAFAAICEHCRRDAGAS